MVWSANEIPFRPFGYFAPKDIYIFWLSNIFNLSWPDEIEGYYRNVLCVLSLISTLLFQSRHHWCHMESSQNLKDGKKSTQNKLSSWNLTHDKSRHLKMSQMSYHKVLSQNFTDFISSHFKITLMPYCVILTINVREYRKGNQKWTLQRKL